MINRTTDELIELAAHCNDRISYKRACKMDNTHEEETIRDRAISELINRGITADIPGSPQITVVFI